MSKLQEQFEECYRGDPDFRKKVKMYYKDFAKQEVSVYEAFKNIQGFGARLKRKHMYLTMWLENPLFRDKVLNTSIEEYFESPQADYIYIVTNPAFREHVKIGRTTNPTKRLSSYNICSPFKDFKYELCEEVDNPKIIEDYFRNKYVSPNEWYNISTKQAVSEITTLIELLNS